MFMQKTSFGATISRNAWRPPFASTAPIQSSSSKPLQQPPTHNWIRGISITHQPHASNRCLRNLSLIPHHSKLWANTSRFLLWGGAPKQGGTLPSFNFRGRQIPPHQGCWMMIGFRGCLQTGVQVPRPWYQVHSCLHTNGVILHSCSHRPICPRPRWSLLPMCSGVQTGAKLVHQGQYLRALKTLSSITCPPSGANIMVVCFCAIWWLVRSLFFCHHTGDNFTEQLFDIIF